MNYIPISTGDRSVDKVFEAATVHIYCGRNATVAGISLTLCCSELIFCPFPSALASICTPVALRETLQTPLHTSNCLYPALCNVLFLFFFCINRQPDSVFQIGCLNLNENLQVQKPVTDVRSEQRIGEEAMGLTLV